MAYANSAKVPDPINDNRVSKVKPKEGERFHKVNLNFKTINRNAKSNDGESVTAYY